MSADRGALTAACALLASFTGCFQWDVPSSGGEGARSVPGSGRTLGAGGGSAGAGGSGTTATGTTSGTTTSTDTTTSSTSSSATTTTDTITTTDTTTSSSTDTPRGAGGSGAGGAPSRCTAGATCSECLTCASSADCKKALDDCMNDPACAKYDSCLGACASGDNACLLACETNNAAGSAAHHALDVCLLCTACPGPCNTANDATCQ